MVDNKKGAGPLLIAAIGPIVWGVIILASMIYGGVFYNTIKSDISSGAILTNPWLWIIAILVLIMLIRRRR